MARCRRNCLLLFSLLLALIALVSKTESTARASLLTETDVLRTTGSSPEGQGQPRRLWATRAWERVSQPIRRALQSLKSAFSRRSKAEADERLQSAEAIAMRHFDCFNLTTPEAKAGNAISTVCENLEEDTSRRNCSLYALIIAEQLRKVGECMSKTVPSDTEQRIECLKLYRLFLVHPFLRETVTGASAEEYKDAERWFNGLEFSSGPPDIPLIPGGDSLSQAFARLNWSAVGTADNQHIRLVHLLKSSSLGLRSTRNGIKRVWNRMKRRQPTKADAARPEAVDLLTRGYELFVNIPPHADPVAVRLTTTMLADGVSCPAGSSSGIPEKIVWGRRRPVKTAQVIEAAILIAVERLFDASDCVSFERNGDQADMTCRLLEKYDQYMQAGRPKATEIGFSGRLQNIKSLDLSSSPASDEETNSSSTGPSPPEMKAVERPSSSLNENEGMSALQELQMVSQELREEQPEQLAEIPLEESTGRTGRILMYTQNAAASAVAISRLSLKSSTVTMRIVTLCLRSSFFTRQAVRLLLAFMGRELVPQEGLSIFLRKTNNGKRYLGMYLKALVELSTGSKSFGKLSAAVAGTAADEERRVIRKQEQLSASFLQVAAEPANQGKTTLTLTVATAVLLTLLFVAFSATFSSVVVAMALLLVFLLLAKNLVNTFNALGS